MEENKEDILNYSEPSELEDNEPENTNLFEAVDEIINTAQEEDEKSSDLAELPSEEDKTIDSAIAPVADFSDVDLDIDNQEENDNLQEIVTVRPVKFPQFDETPPNRSIKKNLDIMQDVSMHVSVELGRTKSSIREVMEMEIGSIVELDKIAGEQVEIFVNEKLVAKGEVIVIEDKFGVRVTSTNLSKNNV